MRILASGGRFGPYTDTNTAYREAARKRQNASWMRFTANWRKAEKWLLNYARNANNPIPVASAITTKKLNAPRQLPSMRVPNRVTSHQRKRKIEVRYECRRWSSHYSRRSPTA